MRALAAIAAALALLLVPPASGLGHPTQPLDRDHDTVQNQDDNCPDDFNSNQLDTDGDGRPGGSSAVNEGGDACDTDDDADTVDDPVDNCPLIANADQRDTDSDGTGDLCDEDDDADGVADRDDVCVKVADPDQKDADGDFIGDACDPDTVAPPPPAAVPDTAAPSVRVKLARRVRADAIYAGLPVEVRCSEACRLTASVRRAGRKLGLGTARLGGAGATFVFVRMPVVRRSMTASVRIEAADAAGNVTRVTRRVRVTR